MCRPLAFHQCAQGDADAGIVDQDVQSSCPLLGIDDHLFGAGRIGNIGNQ
jgi:hypothetical protein